MEKPADWGYVRKTEVSFSKESSKGLYEDSNFFSEDPSYDKDKDRKPVISDVDQRPLCHHCQQVRKMMNSL